METKRVLELEGRDAKNLIAYSLSAIPDTGQQKSPFQRKAPPPPSLNASLLLKPMLLKTAAPADRLQPLAVRVDGSASAAAVVPPRVRSASTGRDKRSELHARYWALLFGNLQRAISEIYATVESYENLSSCQETILVLENYCRDFRALADWFQVSWDYESRPQQQRHGTPLAWDVRKSNPTSPRLRARSASSPVPPASLLVSGPASPSCPTSYSGKSSPCPTIEECCDQRPADESHASPAIDVTHNTDGIAIAHQYCQTDLDDDFLTLIQWREKYEPDRYPTIVVDAPPTPTTAEESSVTPVDPLPLVVESIAEPAGQPDERPIGGSQVTANQLDAMESQFLAAETRAKSARPIDVVPLRQVQAKVDTCLAKKAAAPAVSVSGSVAISAPPPKYSSVLNRSATMSGLSASSRSRAPSMSARPATALSVRTAALNSTLKSASSTTSLSVRKPTSARFALQTASKSAIGKPAALPIVPASTGAVQSSSSVAPKRFAARSKTMIEMPNSKSRVAQKFAGHQPRCSREDIASSSSTLKASNELIGSSLASSPIGSRTHLQKFDAPRAADRGSTEAKSTAKSSASGAQSAVDDGWLMVKARRRSSLHWANRFNQPTGYASLPSLALPGQAGEADGKPAAVAARSAVPTRKEHRSKSTKSVATSATATNGKTKIAATSTCNALGARKTATATKDASTASRCGAAPAKAAGAAKASKATGASQSVAERQKSDLTGLKLATLRREYMRTAARNKFLSNAPQKPIPEAIAPDCPPQQLAVPVMHRRDQSVSSSCDEYEFRDDFESDEDQRKLLEEQESLERQIRELQNTEIDVDTETDETDCETIHEDGSFMLGIDYLTSASVNGMSADIAASADGVGAMSLESRYQLLLSDMSQGERTETLATLRAFVARHPGRAQELHQKLSSPSRRRSLHETLKLYQAKHSRAQEKRDALNREKAQKIQVLLARVEDVKAAKQQLIEEKRLRMEERLQRAAENRTQYLRDKIRKAHDEEEKMKEIAFIKNIEAQNKRLDFMESWREQEGRLLDLEQERQKRVEEKAAKEAAVEKRRLKLEQERQRRLEKMNETRRVREQRIGEMQEQREKLRQQVARDKARDREERLLALQVQQQHSAEELQRKIIQKQQESARRHEENIEHIRQRALELSIPGSRQPDGADGDGATAGDNDLSSLVSDVSREYASKSTKKRLKKIAQKLADCSAVYMAELEPLPAYIRNGSEVPKFLGQLRKGVAGPLGIERPLNQLMRVADKTQVYDYQCLWIADGLGVLAQIVRAGMPDAGGGDCGGPSMEITRKAQITAVQLYRKLCLQCSQIGRHAVLANSFVTLCDALLKSLQTPDETAPGQPVELSTELMIACLSPFPASMKKFHPSVLERLPLVISYVVATGLVDTMARRLQKIRESVEQHGSVILSLLATIGLLTKFGDLCPKGSADPTRFLATVRATDLLGTVSLLHSTVIPLGECIPPRTVSLAAAAFRLLVTIANLDLAVFQDVLDDEALAFQLLDVAGLVLTYCGPKAIDKSESSAVIVDLIATLGFYCAKNTRNQNRLTSEQSARIIKALSRLPRDFDMIVYPTLITVIADNADARQIVARDFDMKMLDEFQQSEHAQRQKVVSVLNASAKPAPAKKA